MPGVMRALTQHCGGTVTAPPMPCASPPQPSFQPPICFPPPSSAFYPNLTLSAGSCPPAFSIFYKLFLGGGEGQGAFSQHLGRLPPWYPCLLPVSATLRTCPQPTSLFATETAPADITRGRPVAGRSGHLRPLRGHPGRSAVSLPGDSRPLSHSTCVLEASHVVPSQPDLFSRPLLLPSY